MKKILFAILILFLTACASPQTSVPTSTPRATVTASITPTLTATATEIPFTTLMPEEQAAQYLAGKVQDVSALNFEQRKAFSIALDEKKKEQRGENPVIYTDKTGAKFYIDPISGKFLPVGNGTNAEQQTIDANAPRAIDDEGYTHIFHNGTWIKIEGSQNIQFDNFENFNWPAGEKVDPQWVPDPNLHDLTTPEYLFVAYGAKVNMAPIFFLGKELGEINIPGFGINGTLMGYVINGNDPFSVTALLNTGAPTLYGDNFSAGSTGDLGEVSHFYQKLQVNKVYYLMYEVDQIEEFAKTYPKSNGKEVTTDYQGLAPSSQTHDIITGKIKSNDLALVEIAIIVEPGK